jgi:hypothetical protein
MLAGAVTRLDTPSARTQSKLVVAMSGDAAHERQPTEADKMSSCC